MIDLHLHTTASDGRCSPLELPERVASAGITAFAVTDHDTSAAVRPAAERAAALGVRCVSGIEVTAVLRGRDVHVLGYFIDPDAPVLGPFLTVQRTQRVERAREIADRLARLGVPIDVDRIVKEAEGRTGRAIARPRLAQALIEAGHVTTTQEAFDRFLADDQPAYVPHRGASPAEAVALIGQAGGVASLAHPGVLKGDPDALIAELADAGLTAVEAYHSEHDAVAQQRFLVAARRHNLLVTGGSDYHGEGMRRAEFFGRVGLPDADFNRLLDRASDCAWKL